MVTRPARYLLAIGGFALVMRGVIALWTTTIAADSQAYLRTAELFSEGRFEEALMYRDLHPAFPLLTAWASKALGSLEASAWLLSSIVSSLAVVPLYFLVRTWWSERLALWTAFVYALHPVLALESSEALPTGFYLGLFAAALAAGVGALRGGPWAFYPLAGLAAGLAYLTRAEGIVVIAFLSAGSVFTLVGLIRARVPRARWIGFATGTLAAAVIFAATALPYIRWVSQKNGRFGITRKGGSVVVDEAFQRDTDWAPKTPAPRPYVYTVWKAGVQAGFWPYLPVFVLGFACTRRLEGRWRSLLPLVAMGVLAVAPPLLLFALNRYFRPSHRYMLAGMMLLLPWLAAGVLAVVDALGRLSARRSWPAWLAYAPLLLFVIPAFHKAVRPRRAEEAVFIEAGRWLREQAAAPRILTTEPKIAWYGRCELVHDNRWVERPAAALRQTRSAFAVVDRDSLRHLEGPATLDRLEREGFERAALFGEDGLTVWIFRPKPGP
jgi:4-amino-4-deoxy-L-arabinose transferase-like glycosyltransferase